MLLLATPLCTLFILAIQESKLNESEVNSSNRSASNTFDYVQLSVPNPVQPLNDFAGQDKPPTFSNLEVERINHSLIKKDLRISHQKYKIVKLEGISLILGLLTIISFFTAVLMYRKHHKLISGLRKHGLPFMKDAPEFATELLNRNVSTPTVEVSLTQSDINNMLVSALQEAINIWSEENDLPLVEFAYQSQIWTITNDNGTLRVRSLERYLSFDKIPKNPRWKYVTKSIHFVLSTLEKDNHRYMKLEKILQDITVKLKKFYG